jgi:acetyltransferase-like isoleucine patch superfamily enzyme
MNSPARFLRAIMPRALKQLLLRARLRSQGARVDFGTGARIDSGTEFAGHASLDAGARVFGSKVGRWTYFGDSALTIFADVGAFCSIAPHAIIGGGKHPTQGYVTTSPRFYSTICNPWGTFPGSMHLDSEVPRTFIGNDVWIGYSAVVLPGLRVGDGAVIGAGAVVTRDVEPYAIVAGVPARNLRFRFAPGDVEWLLDLRWWDWPDARLKELRPQFCNIASLRSAVGSPAETMAAGAEP